MSSESDAGARPKQESKDHESVERSQEMVIGTTTVTTTEVGTEQDVQYCEEITLAGEICDDNKAVPEESEEYADKEKHTSDGGLTGLNVDDSSDLVVAAGNIEGCKINIKGSKQEDCLQSSSNTGQGLELKQEASGVNIRTLKSSVIAGKNIQSSTIDITVQEPKDSGAVNVYDSTNVIITKSIADTSEDPAGTKQAACTVLSGLAVDELVSRLRDENFLQDTISTIESRGIDGDTLYSIVEKEDETALNEIIHNAVDKHKLKALIKRK